MRRLIWIVPLLALFVFIGMRIGEKKAQENGAGGGPGGGQAGAPGGGGGRPGGSGGPGGGAGGRPVAVETAAATSRDIEKSVDAVGSAISPQIARLSPPTAGRITMLTVREGDRVTVGQLLAQIDASQAEGTVLERLAGVSEAEARLAQAEATVGSSDVTIESAIRTQRAALASAQAALVQAQRTQDAQIASAQAAVAQQQAAVNSAQADVASAAAQEKAAEATLKSAQARLRRTEALFKDGYLAAQDLDDARATAEAAQGTVGVAKETGRAAQARVAQARAQQRAAEAQVTVTRRQAQAQVATAEANVRSAQAALESAEANRAQKPANRRNIEALRATVRAAKGQLDQANAQRSNTDLRSPIEGTVTDRAADPGSLAQPGTPVLTVQSVKRLFVEATLPVEFAPAIGVGGTASVTFDALPNRKFSGRIADVNRAADPQSRQFLIRVVLENKDEAIRPGMFGHIRVVLERRKATVAVPLNAVTEGDNGPTVAVVDEKNTVRVVPVKTGAKDDQYIEILDGLKPGEKVVTLKGRTLREGQTVTVTDPTAKPAPTGGRP